MVDMFPKFELPVPDWHDEQGRIYKDRLIQNFNAIEQRLIELSEVDSTVDSTPDISKVVYPDVTLNSSDEKIVNLKSLINIMNLKNYPIECEFTGDNLCKRLAYYDEINIYRVIINQSISPSNTNKYILLDYGRGKIECSPTLNKTGTVLIGMFNNGKIFHVNGDDYININLLYYLPNMNNTQHKYTFDAGTRDNYDCTHGINVNGRTIGAADTNTKTGGSNSVIFRDTGRTSS